jgi:succinyl-CoA synthetase beta subunit
MDEYPEHEGKKKLDEVGIPVPDGRVVEDDKLRGNYTLPAVVKAQVPVSGRLSHGGIRFVESEEKLENAVAELFGSILNGHEVKEVLIEEQMEVSAEYYLSLRMGDASRPELMLSTHGGRRIENISENLVSTVQIDPLVGPSRYHLRICVNQIEGVTNVADETMDELYSIVRMSWAVLRDNDLRLVEINPLAKTERGLVALDSKLVVDENASYRQNHPDLDSKLTDLEQSAQADDIYLREGEGEIGLITTGAGIGMATIDAIVDEGFDFSGFVELRGDEFDADHLKQVFEYLIRCGSRTIIVNIPGSVVDLEKTSKQIAELAESEVDTPIVARYRGVKEEIAQEIAENAGLDAPNASLDAVKLACANVSK